jgi:hypothetical protein
MRHLLLAGWALVAAVQPSAAFDNLDKGRTARELFKTNCTACHRTPVGLGTSTRSLYRFLSEHYTSGTAAAEILADYLASANRSESKRTRPHRRPARAGKADRKN